MIAGFSENYRNIRKKKTVMRVNHPKLVINWWIYFLSVIFFCYNKYQIIGDLPDYQGFPDFGGISKGYSPLYSPHSKTLVSDGSPMHHKLYLYIICFSGLFVFFWGWPLKMDFRFWFFSPKKYVYIKKGRLIYCLWIITQKLGKIHEGTISIIAGIIIKLNKC